MLPSGQSPLRILRSIDINDPAGRARLPIATRISIARRRLDSRTLFGAITRSFDSA